MILRQKKVRSRLGLSTTLCLSCAALLLLPLSAEVLGQTSTPKAVDPVGTPGDGGSRDAGDENAKPASNSQQTIDFLLQAGAGQPHVDAVDFAITDELCALCAVSPVVANGPKPPENLENRVKRLEKLVERLVVALESRAPQTQRNIPQRDNTFADEFAPDLLQDPRADKRETPTRDDEGGYYQERPARVQNQRQQIVNQLNAIDRAIKQLNRDRKRLMRELESLKRSGYGYETTPQMKG